MSSPSPSCFLLISVTYFHELRTKRKNERFNFYNRIFDALLIVLILLIAVTYFHEMRSEDCATGTGEISFLQQDIQSFFRRTEK